MALANFKTIQLTDDTLSQVQANVQQAFANVDQSTSHSVKTVTASYQITPSDDTVLVDPSRGPLTITLPSLGMLAKPVTVRTVGTSKNAVTLRPMSVSVLIDGQASIVLTSSPIRIVSDQKGYWVG